MGEMKISRFTASTEISYKKKHAQLLLETKLKRTKRFRFKTASKLLHPIERCY